MPYKNAEKKRVYQRDYMRHRRAAVRPWPDLMLDPAQEAPGPPRRIDRSRPFAVESRYPWPAYLVQNGYWYHWETEELVGPAKE